MTDKTTARAFRELHEAWLDLVSEILSLFVKPVDWLNRVLRSIHRLIAQDEEIEASIMLRDRLAVLEQRVERLENERLVLLGEIQRAKALAEEEK